jgi:TctA family transporter
VLFRRSSSFAALARTASTTPAGRWLITAGFGLLGYSFLRLDLDPAPLILGFILGPMLEEYFRRSLLLSRGSFTVFFTHRSARRS